MNRRSQTDLLDKRGDERFPATFTIVQLSLAIQKQLCLQRFYSLHKACAPLPLCDGDRRVVEKTLAWMGHVSHN